VCQLLCSSLVYYCFYCLTISKSEGKFSVIATCAKKK
jgi:hypothetical protein